VAPENRERTVHWTDAFGYVCAVWISTRATVLLVGYIAVLMVGNSAARPPLRVYGSELLNLPARWDAEAYLDIAVHGYRWDPGRGAAGNSQYFPMLPWLMRAGGRMFGAPLIVGVVVSVAAFLGALLYVYRLAGDELGDEAAATSVALLASYPFAVFFSAAYTESLFLLASVAAFWHARQRQALRAGLWGLIAGLTRPQGFLLSVPLGWIALADRRRGAERPGAMSRTNPRAEYLAAAMPVVGVLIFSSYLYALTGRPFSWISGQATSGIGVSRAVTERAALVAHGEFRQGLWGFRRGLPVIKAMDLGALGVALATLWPVGARLGVPYALVDAVIVAPAILSRRAVSMGRYTSVLFPLFMWLAVVIPPRQRVGWISAFAMLQALGAVLFFTGRGFL
jgi:hypothetical protein